MRKVFVHIGLHKTGTTFLQQAVFPAMERLTTFRAWNSIRSVLTAGGSDPVLISDEGLSGQFYEGSWLDEFIDNMSTLHDLLGDPSIIVGFRRHDALIISLYKQYLQEGGTESLLRFFDPFVDDGIIQRRDLLFEVRLRHVTALFSRIFVYTLEELRSNTYEFIGRLARFIGVSIPSLTAVGSREMNAGLRGRRQASLLRGLNRVNRRLASAKWVPTLENPLFRKLGMTPRMLCQYGLARLPSGPLVLPEEVREVVLADYGADWKYVMDWRKRDTSGQSAVVRSPVSGVGPVS